MQGTTFIKNISTIIAITTHFWIFCLICLWILPFTCVSINYSRYITIHTFYIIFLQVVNVKRKQIEFSPYSTFLLHFSLRQWLHNNWMNTWFSLAWIAYFPRKRQAHIHKTHAQEHTRTIPHLEYFARVYSKWIVNTFVRIRAPHPKYKWAWQSLLNFMLMLLCGLSISMEIAWVYTESRFITHRKKKPFSYHSFYVEQVCHEKKIYGFCTRIGRI